MPEDQSNQDRDKVCFRNATEASAVVGNDEAESEIESYNRLWHGVPKIAWPFVITGIWCITFSCGYAILGIFLNQYYII